MMKRVMCVYLPRWPIQRLRHDEPALQGEAIVLTEPNGTRGPRVALCSTRAERLGVRADMPLAEALAVAPGVHVRERDFAKDAHALGVLAKWLERYSPTVGVEEEPDPHGLLLDITGCASYFHGEDQLLQRAVNELAGEKWRACIAIADTAGAAWGLARYARTPFLAPAGETEKALGTLPIAALRLPEETVDLLSRLGIDCVGRLLDLPREDLPARFGPGALQRLDQALGRLAEPITPHRKLPEVQAIYRFEYPTEDRRALDLVLARMVSRVEAVLEERGWGARQVECWLYHESAPPARFSFGLCRASASRGYLGMLLRTQLEQVTVAAAVRTVWLRVPTAEPVGGCQGEFFEGESAEELAGLIDRLSVRLGREAVTRVTLVPDAQPECVCRFEPLVAGSEPRPISLEQRAKRNGKRTSLSLGRGSDTPAFSPQNLRVFVHRPLQLLPEPASLEVTSIIPDGPPVRFCWSGTDYRVDHSHGPERIETGWWRGDDVQRDYYVVTTHLGTRFWLFRRRDDGRWFLHGCFD
jgi:protein ImuB